MTTGRNVPTPSGLEALTLSSGITVGIRKVSPHTRKAISKAIPRPRPPMIEQDYGDGKTRMEPNEDDPQHQRNLEDWQQAIIDKAQEVMYSLGVVVEIDHDLLAARRAMFDELGIPMHRSDHIAFIQHIAVATDEDAERIANAITNTSQPTEEAVQDHLETFPDHVQESPVPALAAENSGTQL